MEKPLNTCIFFPLMDMVVSSVFFFLKKKKAPSPKVKILCLEGQINIYIVA
jgi:hypothetical protein